MRSLTLLLPSRWSAALVGVLLSSCAMVAVPRHVTFSEAEFTTYRGSGSATIVGHFMVTSEDGLNHLGDGCHVTLLPVTSYTREMVDRVIGDGENLAPSDPRLRPYVRLTKADDGGNFVFDHLPAGEYFVSGLAEWSVGDDTQYQWACERVTVGRGQSLRITLSKNLQRPGKPTMVIWALE